ncbi:MAG: response regulator transcription factor [Lutimonas sp.]|jgi:two-component system alkaline phosphatase synthesis response regulator PhoP
MDSENIRILLVDDEPDILELVGYHLKKEGFKVKTAHNGFEALDIADDFMPHLILLDIMMPEMDGMETCEKIRSSETLKNVLIVFFTARGEDYSQVAGFDAGADDYITKPIKPRVLVSKVKALLRRLGTSVENAEDVLEFNDFTIFKNEYYVLKNGEQIVLPKKEFELLVLLASSPNKVLNREYILRNVWGHDVVVGGRTIDVHIRKLREKIGDRYIDTIKGVGYKFID